ncbi:hypothetical protein BD413DRAFT_610361 [Trametes elegans]|nr:hypothetical protein BD413DRAFT_610361 [Trametes elegans]
MPLLAPTVEESREKRIERQQARFRDRGGIFKPSERNGFLDILLARGVNGESPKPEASSRPRSRSHSASPSRRDHVSREVASSRASKKPSRKSLGEKAAVRRVQEEGEHVEPQSEEPIAGPSKPSAQSTTAKVRITKGKTKRTRSNANKPDTIEASHADEQTTSGPTKPKRAAKSIKPASLDPAPKPKRAVKRKAPSEPTPAANPEPEPPSDDEPLAPRRKAKTKASTASSKPKRAATKKRVVVDGGDDNGEDQEQPSVPVKARQRKTAKPEQMSSTRTIDPEISQPDPLSPKKGRPDKGKRKAVVVTAANEDAEREFSRYTLPNHVTDDACRSQAARPGRSKRAKRAVADVAEDPVTSSDAETRTKPSKPRKDRTAAKPPEDGRSNMKAPRSKRATKRAVEHDGEAPDALPMHRAYVQPESSSPDRPLARNSQVDQNSMTKNDGHGSREDTENDVPVPPRKKRPLVEDEALPAQVKRTKTTGLVRPPPPDSPTVYAARPKAPPVFAPKGTKLKPKPKPRLSMFPAPENGEEDSDRDPIDFLS